MNIGMIAEKFRFVLASKELDEALGRLTKAAEAVKEAASADRLVDSGKVVNGRSELPDKQ